jgi:aryl-alcohol dehydrogenase-like predicted oxidoreductase
LKEEGEKLSLRLFRVKGLTPSSLEILTRTDTLEALEQLKKSGKVRATGISAKSPEGIAEACRTLNVIMAPFSQKDPSLAEALGKAHDAGLGVLAIKSLFSGHLEARPAIEFVLRKPFIDTLVLGTIDPMHLREAAEVAELCLNPKPA